MLEIIPMQAKDREKEICSRTAGADADSRVLVMTDGAEELGYVVVSLREAVLYIHEFNVNGRTDFSAEKPGMEEIFILDTLMRSAASFGENNGANHIKTTFPDFHNFFKLRKFDVTETCAETPMSTIVHYE
ncbi:MAG: hypothetical protein IJF56_10725 [Clostridia bacterium]|nr:hypothetical protein [Clostridia bacterium]